MIRLRLFLVAIAMAVGGCGSDGPTSEYAGAYHGSYAGLDFGTLTASVGNDGQLSVIATSSLSHLVYGGAGRVEANGSASANGSGTGAGGGITFSFSGNFTLGNPAKVRGTWSSSNGGSGTWNASRE
jgi:hypothetical protein